MGIKNYYTIVTIFAILPFLPSKLYQYWLKIFQILTKKYLDLQSFSFFVKFKNYYLQGVQ